MCLTVMESRVRRADLGLAMSDAAEKWRRGECVHVKKIAEAERERTPLLILIILEKMF